MPPNRFTIDASFVLLLSISVRISDTEPVNAPFVPRMSVFVVVVSTRVTRDMCPLALIASVSKFVGNAAANSEFVGKSSTLVCVAYPEPSELAPPSRYDADGNLS